VAPAEAAPRDPPTAEFFVSWAQRVARDPTAAPTPRHGRHPPVPRRDEVRGESPSRRGPFGPIGDCRTGAVLNLDRRSTRGIRHRVGLAAGSIFPGPRHDGGAVRFRDLNFQLNRHRKGGEPPRQQPAWRVPGRVWIDLGAGRAASRPCERRTDVIPPPQYRSRQVESLPGRPIIADDEPRPPRTARAPPGRSPELPRRRTHRPSSSGSR
jgi:hypothetical protein